MIDKGYKTDIMGYTNGYESIPVAKEPSVTTGGTPLKVAGARKEVGIMQGNPEKIDRNTEIYLKKMGYISVDDETPTKKPITYRELSAEYDLSIPRLLYIVNRERKKIWSQQHPEQLKNVPRKRQKKSDKKESPKQ